MAQQNNAKTVRERVDSRRGLQATVRPATTYDNARGGYVERPFGAGRDMQALAGALSQFDRSLGGFLDQKLDKQIEEGAAKGQVTFAENPSENKNMQDWKAFTEANPQYTNENPWVKKGYEQARLQALGLDYEKGLNDAFVQSGLVNEKDQKNVDTFFQDYDKTFREQAGIDQYEDKIMLASNFTKLTSTAKQGLYSRHSQFLQSQNEDMLGQQYADVTVKSIDNMFDPAINGRTRFLSDPNQREDNLNLIALTVMENVKAATDKGYRNAKAPELAAQMIFTAADKAENADILEALDLVRINGVTLSSLPGVAAKMEQREQQRIEKQRADTRWWWAQQERQEKLEEKQTFNLTYTFSQSGLPATEDNIRQWEKDTDVQIPRRLMGQFMKGVNEIHSTRENAVKLSPLVREELTDLRMRLRTGQAVSGREAVNASIQTGDDYYVNAYTDSDNDENKARAEDMKEVGSSVWSMFTKADEEAISFTGDTSQLETSQRLGMEARQLVQDKLELAFEDFERDNKGVKPSHVQRLHMKRTAVNEVYNEVREKQAIEEAQAAQESTRTKKKEESQTVWEKLFGSTKEQSPVDPAVAWLLGFSPVSKSVAMGFSGNQGRMEEYIRQFFPEKLEEYNRLFPQRR